MSRYTRGIDEDSFLQMSNPGSGDPKIEVIGEAVKSLPPDLKVQRPEVRWDDVAGLRDVLIHGDHRVNAARLWSVVKDDLEILAQAVQGMAGHLEDS